MMKDVDILNMWMLKMSAHSDKYFQLFEKYIGKFNRCLLAFIGNETVISDIIKTNPKAEYVIYDNILIKDTLAYTGLDLSRTTFISDTQNFFKVIDNMPLKFDKIIMNPPYSKNLHLQILAKAIEKLDEDGTCVNLSPVRWLQDPFNQFKQRTDLSRFKNSILNHLKNIEVIDAKTANEAFNIGLYANLGIYECCSNTVNINYEDFWKKQFTKVELSIFNKVTAHKKSIEDVCEKNRLDGIRVLIAAIAGNRGTLPIYKELAYVVDGKKDGKDWTKCKNNGGYEKEEGMGIPISVKFASESEAQNFYDSCKTDFYRFICKYYITDQHIPLYWLPFMGDDINPRTKKVGYAGEWTNEDFYKFFNITEEEQKLIENNIANKETGKGNQYKK